MSLQRGINLRALAEKMGQCSGAEVRGICTEAGTPTFFHDPCGTSLILGPCPSSGMYALRERRQHVTQEDFEFAVAKVSPFWIRTLLLVDRDANCSRLTGSQEEPGGQHLGEQALLVICTDGDLVLYCSIIHFLPQDSNFE